MVVNEGVYFVEHEDSAVSGVEWFLKFLDLESSETSVAAQLERPLGGVGSVPVAVAPDRSWFLYVSQDQSDADLMLVEGFR